MTPPPLLLYSLAHHGELLLDILDVVEARHAVEVGSEEGLFAEELDRWATPLGATVHCIDPEPRPPLEQLVASSSSLILVREPSLEALPQLPPADVYFLDGDHNYYTVRCELELIHELAPGAVVVVQDVGWPCARRDFYYAPERIPDEDRHEWTSTGGIVPQDPGIVPGGYRFDYAVALHEGGPRNGVLTAVEDHLDEHPELAYSHNPLVFGLGVIWPKWARYGRRLRDLLSPFDRDPVLQRVEENRVDLYLRVLELQEALAAAAAPTPVTPDATADGDEQPRDDEPFEPVGSSTQSGSNGPA